MRSGDDITISGVTRVMAFASALLAPLVAGCMESSDCYRLQREMPVIELVDHLGDPGVPYYDTTLAMTSVYREYPGCPSFDSMIPGTHISITNVYVGSDSSMCQMMTADAQFATGVISFDLPLTGSSFEESVLHDVSQLSLGDTHLLLGSSSARFAGCTGTWVTVVSGGPDTYGDPYGDPGEGGAPPWLVFRLFRPSDDLGCAELRTCVDGFTARMVMRP